MQRNPVVAVTKLIKIENYTFIGIIYSSFNMQFQSTELKFFEKIMGKKTN